ncbi:hypothetical protein E2I00_010354, partial [Balaenoptera physalus]
YSVKLPLLKTRRHAHFLHRIEWDFQIHTTILAIHFAVHDLFHGTSNVIEVDNYNSKATCRVALFIRHLLAAAWKLVLKGVEKSPEDVASTLAPRSVLPEGQSGLFPNAFGEKGISKLLALVLRWTAGKCFGIQYIQKMKQVYLFLQETKDHTAEEHGAHGDERREEDEVSVNHTNRTGHIPSSLSEQESHLVDFSIHGSCEVKTQTSTREPDTIRLHLLRGLPFPYFIKDAFEFLENDGFVRPQAGTPDPSRMKVFLPVLLAALLGVERAHSLVGMKEGKEEGRKFNRETMYNNKRTKIPYDCDPKSGHVEYVVIRVEKLDLEGLLKMGYQQIMAIAKLCTSDKLWEQIVQSACDHITPDMRALAQDMGWRQMFFTNKLQLQRHLRKRIQRQGSQRNSEL